jgi:hypothetical protein
MPVRPRPLFPACVLRTDLTFSPPKDEKSLDSQVRFKWTPGASAIWDNRVSIHAAVFDYEGKEPRHGTRVSSLAEVPYFDPKSPTRREALGFDKPEDFAKIGERKEIQY